MYIYMYMYIYVYVYIYICIYIYAVFRYTHVDHVHAVKIPIAQTLRPNGLVQNCWL